MPTCSAYGCSYKSCRKKIPGKTTHKFPFSRPNILKQWVFNMRRADWKPSQTSILCSDHFEPECFDRSGSIVRLHRDAVPTLFNFPDYVQEIVRRKKLKSRVQLKDNGTTTSTATAVKEVQFEDNTTSSPSVVTVVVNILGVRNDHNYSTTLSQLKQKLFEKENAKKIKLLQQSIRRMKKKNAISVIKGTTTSFVKVMHE